MNLKTTYHYSYFIYPFLVNLGSYKDFLSKFLVNGDRWELNIDNELTDLDTHVYFLPYVKRFLFPTIYWTNDYREQFNKMSDAKKLDAISKLSSVTFSYNIDSKKASNYKFSDTDINFQITNIKLICFEPEICFLIFKTELDKKDGIYSDDILDFNYKFRTLNPRYLRKKKTEGISIMNSEFSGCEDLSNFIEKLLYGYEDLQKENIYFDRLFTYSYMCLDEKEWNDNVDLNAVINEFYKFLYVLPGSYGSTFDPGFKGVKDNTYTRWKYSIYGFTRESGVVFASEREAFNKIKLPANYENMYFYIFLLAFFQRIALILFSQELMRSGRDEIDSLKRRFTKFTHFSWFSQITNSEQGMDIWKKWQKAFDLPELFDEVQKEYAEYYEFAVAKGQMKMNNLLIVIYIVSLLFSGIGIMMNFRVIDTHSQLLKITLMSILLMSIIVYPFYWVGKVCKRRLSKKRK